MLRQARERDPGGSYERRDLREMRTLSEEFDGIWASGCLYHLSRPEFADWLKEAGARLRPGGVLYFSMKEGGGEKFEEAPGAGYPGGEKAKTVLRGRRFYAYYSRDELAGLVSAGFVLAHEQRAEFGERNFEFFLRRKTE